MYAFSQILQDADTILFSLLILRGLFDSKGRVWRCHSDQLYAVEVTYTLSRTEEIAPESRTLEFLKLLPSVRVESPSQYLEQIGGKLVHGEE
jgi:hypothetical protein